MRETLIDYRTLEQAATLIRHAAHPLRLRILDFLRREARPKSVAEITGAAAAPQATVSQHLRILKDLGLIKGRRHGHYVLYRVADPRVPLLLRCIGGECRDEQR